MVENQGFKVCHPPGGTRVAGGWHVPPILSYMVLYL